MTTLRPEHDAGGPEAPYAREEAAEAAAAEAALRAAVGGLADPLNDPLPGQLPGTPSGPVPGRPSGAAPGAIPEQPAARGEAPPSRARHGRHRGPESPREAGQVPAAPVAPEALGQAPAAPAVPADPSTPSAPTGPSVPASAPVSVPLPPERPVADQGAGTGARATPAAGTTPGQPQEPVRKAGPARPTPAAGPVPGAMDETLISGPLFPPPPRPTADLPDDVTIGLRTDDLRRATAARSAGRATAGAPTAGAPTAAQEQAGSEQGGRAERRKAAKGGRGRRRQEPGPAEAGNGPGTAAHGSAPAKPLSRVEARRAARAAKDSPAVVVSRVVGELFITFGVLMLLFVTYQLWWTNVRADQYAGKETNKIQDSWAKGRQPGAFEPGQGFAIMHIPKLDVVVPIAEGISKSKVLDHGMVGHYSEGKLKTAMPQDKQGNFAVAGHRNTHGEPFRYINRLQPGDKVIVETQDAYYTYAMTKTLPQTSPSNVSVIDPVPPQSGFAGPGRYITLTTCTPEFTSTYRMIVWGKMVDERPRSKGKPDDLVD
ncbi:class E sortase [Streptomyces liangshanensis]|uniref:class E sortase n=1 Tax=Streptomyces liangshanensis TaxID=2717324 RepID=UPI0036D7657C